LITKLTTINKKVKSKGSVSLEDFINKDEIEALEGIIRYEREILQTAIPLVTAGTDPIAVSSIIDGKINAFLHLQKVLSEMFITGLLAIQSGDQPEIVRNKLESVSYHIEVDIIKSTIEKITDFSIKAREKGLLVLEVEVEKISDSIIRTGLKMVIDGVHPVDIRYILKEFSDRRLEEAELYFALLQYGISLIQLGTDTEVLQRVLAGMIPFFQNSINEISMDCYSEHVKSLFRSLKNSNDEPKTLFFEYISSMMRLKYLTTNYIFLMKSFLQLNGKKDEVNRFMRPIQESFINLKRNIKEVFRTGNVSIPEGRVFDPTDFRIEYVSKLLHAMISVQGWNRRLNSEVWKLKTYISDTVKKLT
jgi:flagellar motor component MotA